MRRLLTGALAALCGACGNAAEGEAGAVPPAEEETMAAGIDDFAGDWSGTLSVMGQALPLVLHVQPGAAPAVTLDSPAQGAFGIPAEAAVEDGAFVARWPDLRARYTATLSKDRAALSGTFAQNGMDLRLRMTRDTGPAEAPSRPQAIVGTPPYERVTGSAASVPGVRLAYTATLPEADGPVPGVVLITGSGPQDRDETLMGHKPFAVLADRLTKAGIAVLRYDDRGVARSTGAFEGATSRDFAADAAAMLAELRRVAATRGVTLSGAGLLGHSEGGLVAGLAQTEAAADADFIVALAAPFVPMGDVLIRQTGDLLATQGARAAEVEAAVATQRRVIEAALTEGGPDAACEALAAATGDLPEGVRAEAQILCGPWAHALLRLDPVRLYEGIDVPVLALFGALDAQVAPGPNADAARRVDDVDVRVVAGANHLFQPAETGAVAEYAQIETTMSEDVMAMVAAWIAEAAR